MRIDGIDIEFDVASYLQRKKLANIRQVGINVMACCPFHDDRQPSFGVNIETGAYQCFGCGAKGSLAALVKRLDGFDTIFDAELFLITTYGRYQTTVDQPLDLTFGNDAIKRYSALDEDILMPYRVHQDYLTNRGISDVWQRAFQVGYNRNTRSLTMPYRDERGRLITVKHRRISDKEFWYEPPLPSRLKAETLYALHHVLTAGLRKVAITEAEIDCISVWQAAYEDGYGAVAIGGNQFTREQASKLTRLLAPETEIIVMTDNDEGGRVGRQKIVDALSGRFLVTEVPWDSVTDDDKRPGVTSVKDANDVKPDAIKRLLACRTSVEIYQIKG